MKVVDQSFEIIEMSGLRVIEIAGRSCYKSEHKIGCTLEDPNDCPRANSWSGCDGTLCTNHSSHRFVKQIIKMGHEAMLEHGSATVKFITNRGVTHELVRHRLAAFGQESTRYVNYGGKDIEFIRPVWCHSRVLEAQFVPPRMVFADGTTHEEEIFVCSCLNAEKDYEQLLDHGWRPEQAREVLTNALKTEIVVTANFRQIRHILRLRAVGTTGKPHPQMQALMLPLLRELYTMVPCLFEDIYKEAQDRGLYA